jgi:hypothetical protein
MKTAGEAHAKNSKLNATKKGIISREAAKTLNAELEPLPNGNDAPFGD